MRPIEFRGQRKDNSKWVEGDLILLHYPKMLCIAEKGNSQDWFRTRFHEVIPETVGQFTGLLDKNKKKIWEGDICNVHIFTQELGENLGVREGEREFVAQIKIGKCGEGVLLDNGTEIDSGPLWAYCGFHEESLEIIGSIHDNPELLEEKDYENDKV